MGIGSRDGSLSRRGFLGVIGGAAAAVGLAGGRATSAGSGAATAIGTMPRSKLGAQLWNCIAAYEVDGPEAMALLAQIGYEYVEFAVNYGTITSSDAASGRLGMSAKAFRKSLDDTGLWCFGGQGPSPYPYDDKAWKSWVEDNLVIGSRALGNNVGFPSRYAECRRYADAVHKAHEVARRMGFTGYLFTHLDSPGSFWGTLLDRPNTYAYSAVLQHTTPDVFNVQLDCGNAYAALGSVQAVINQVRAHPGRWPIHHFKDCVPDVYLPDGSWLPPSAGGSNGPAVTPEFGAGVWGLPDPADPNRRPHAGFQDLLTAIRETQDWSQVYVTTESNGSQATCVDYSLLAYKGLNGLTFPYRKRR